MISGVSTARAMWKYVRFAVVHSLRDMWRNRGRTVFALVCVATGVAAVVALRTLAFMVGDELTTNLAEMNRGDIRIYASRQVPEMVEPAAGESVFTQESVDLMRAWADEEDVDLMLARMSVVRQIRPMSEDDRAAPSMPGIILFVEPQRYPFYDVLPLLRPAGVTFAEAFGTAENAVQDDSQPYPIVISRTLARQTRLGLEVGDRLQLGADERTFEVAAIADADAESLLTLPPSALLDYAYLPFEALPLVGEEPLPDQVMIRVPLGRDVTEVDKSLTAYLQANIETEADIDAALARTTVAELEQQNEDTAGVIDDMILVMGLSSLLIGGIGIINTMLVVVSRRTLEIAVLKTLGLKGYRVTLLFLVEALLLGLLGSVIGIVLGVVLSYLIRDVGETAFQIALTWRIYPAALTSGLFLGLVMTALFGFLPTLIAGQVRPAVVLRPNEAQMPAAGLLQVLVTLVVMITVLGLLVDSIVAGSIDYGPVYMIVGGGALVGLFGGIIVANTRFGKPIPDYYSFRLARRFERLDNAITGAVGAVFGWLPLAEWRGVKRRERGRQAITAGLRGLRQAILLYGSLAVGALLASGIMLIGSELWLPFGMGNTKPANDIYYAVQDGDAAWIVAWLAIMVAIGGLIRWAGRALVSVVALASLGVTIGGLAGLFGGRMLETTLYGTGVWDVLAEMSTGVVLTEGALALLGAIFVGYWLLVWAVGKLPPVMLMALVSLVLVSLVAGIVGAAVLIGTWAVIGLVVIAATVWLLIRLRVWRRWMPQAAEGRARSTEGGAAVTEIAQTAAYGTSKVMLGLVLLGGGFLVADVLGSPEWWGGALAMLALALWLWRYLQRSYTVDGRLILREMAGRRGRVASTLLGLSVGIAGLSLVSLTTGAVSQLLRFQLDQSTEGNLVVVGTRPEFGDEIGATLDAQPDVEHYAQVTAYDATLMAINGVKVEVRNPHGFGEDEEGISTNSAGGTGETDEPGLSLSLSERHNMADLPDYDMKAGRKLTVDDAGTHRVMLRESFVSRQYDIDVGDRLMFLFENAPGEADDVTLQLRVIGVISQQSEQTGLEELGNLFSVPPGTLSDVGVDPQGVFAIVQVDETEDEALDRVKAAVTQVPGTLAFELSMITQLIENLLEQLKAIPTLVAWLALLAGTAIIANTVALATQERRRQIGVMKAVGLKGRRVLTMLMIENGLIGLVAGLIGVAVGFVATVVLVLATPSPEQLQDVVQFATMGWLVLMSIGVAIGAAALSAWRAAAEKPMNVLRYE